MKFLGIDPGSKGAIALLDFSTGEVDFRDTPSNLSDINELALWMEFSEARVIGLEDVASVPGTSAKSNFTFGRNLGVVETVARFTKLPVDRIRPKAWQKEIGISVPATLKGAPRKKAIKQTIAKKCNELYPSAEILGPKGGLIDGRSDALMIAHCMALKYQIWS